MKKPFVVLFIFCLLALGSLNGFSQQTDLKNLDETGLKTAFAQDDTGKAVINLFYRKRNGATWRGIIGGGLAGYTINLALVDNYPGTLFVGPVLFSPLWVTSLTSLVKYRQETLLRILHNRENGGTIPLKFRKKLRKKDFKG